MIEGFMHALHSLHSHREIIKELLDFPQVATVLALDLSAHLATVNTLYQLFPPLRTLLELIEHHVQELLRILLDCNVHTLSHMILKRQAESLGVVVRTITEFQEPKHSSQLVHWVLIELDFVAISIAMGCRFLLQLQCHHRVSESLAHVKLLYDSVHVANASKVLYPDVSMVRLDFACWPVIETRR
jgi:hypothetical protein